ncbi:hypothetical protein SAMN02910456_01855 [Ruminococcaceae bacterium YRB3002]|nr:hypothetical protein SAMN02910456_01855 [Ruminococcaceae bacterium YRB3002]
MYLNNEKMTALKVLDGVIIAVVSLPTLLNVWFLVYLLSTGNTRSWLAFMFASMFFLFFIVAGVLIIVWRLLAMRKRSHVRIYNSLFEEDHDGILTYDSIASMTGYPVSKVVSDLIYFQHRNILVNVTLGTNAARVDLTSDNKEFITVACPECGAHVNIRRSGGGKCDHCGTFMRAGTVEDQGRVDRRR